MSGKVYTVEPSGTIDIKVADKGINARKPQTVMDVFKKILAEKPDAPAIAKYDASGKFVKYSYKQYWDSCYGAAKSFIRLGLQLHDTVCIIGFNSPEWVVGDIGCIIAGGMAAGIYTTNKVDACKYVIEHSKCKIVLCEDDEQAEKFVEIKKSVPDLKIVIWGADSKMAGTGIYNWAQFKELGLDIPDAQVEERIAAQKPEHCCTLIYTSGTTGKPKAVMVSHDNCTWTSAVTYDLYKLPKVNRIVSYLPLSHIAAQMLDVHGPMYDGATVYFAKPDALKGSIVLTLNDVKPTIFFGVPRVWEKIAEKMKAKGAETKGLAKKISTWGKVKMLADFRSKQAGGSGVFGAGLAKGLVGKKVKAALGLDQCAVNVTGAAPISMDVLEYFASLDIAVLELYGMSESSGPQTTNTPSYHRCGSIGKPIPGAMQKIENPDKDGNGEICFAGRHIMMGYLYNEAATKDTLEITPEATWLHSGDIGKIDADGYLHITGRLKELIITAGGENIAPVPIEDICKGKAEGISNLMVVGDKLKYLTCIVTVKLEPTDDGGFTDQLTGDAVKVDRAVTTAKGVVDASLVKGSPWNKHIQDGIDAYNNVAVSNAQKIQKFTVISNDFSVPGGELTPTLKLKRKVAADKYASVISAMY